MNETLSQLPDWYRELTKNIKPKKVSPEKQAIINYLKKCIEELEKS